MDTNHTTRKSDHRDGHPSLANLPDTEDRFSWALFYATKVKIPVLPLYETDGERCSCGREGCSNQGKHPRTGGGVDDATTDPEQIRRWWKQWPNANIGGGMGKVSGTIVLDADTPEAVSFLGKHLADTASQTTGSGGRHFFVLYEEGFRNWRKIEPGFDIRTDKGYVVLTPSHNKNGPYTWDKIGSRKPLPEEVRKVIFFHKKKEEKVVRSTSEKVHLAISGTSPSWDSVETVLDNIKDRFSSKETIPDGIRHERLLKIGGSLRGNGVQEKMIVLCFRWINDNLCDPPLHKSELQDIVDSVMNLKKEINNSVDGFEDWVETQKFKGKGGATDRKLLKILLREARKYGERGPKGLDVAIARLDLKDKAGVGRKTVDACIKRIPILESTRNKDRSKCSTLTILYPEGTQVKDDGKLVFSSVRQGDNSYNKREKNYLDCPLDVHSRWGTGRLGLTKEAFLNSIIKNIGPEKSFKIQDLDFINEDYNFKRRHLSDLAREDKFEWRFIERVGRGTYMVPKDIAITFERYKQESGEIKAEQNQLALTTQRRASYKYRLDLEKASAEGKNLEEVPVPKDVPESQGIKTLEKQKEKEEENRKGVEFISRIGKKTSYQ